MRAVIFVDFDGVLHPMGVSALECKDGVCRLTGHNLLRWAPLLWDLVAPYPVDIVIHSSWRTCIHIDQLRDLFPPSMQKAVVGVTEGEGRHDSILQYADHYNITRYLVLDDAPEEFPPEYQHLVVCNENQGISGRRAQDLLRAFLARL